MVLFADVVLPILLVVAAGAALHRAFGLHIASLSKLTIWLLVPAFLFVEVYHSTLSWREIGGITAVIAVTFALIAPPMVLVLRRAAVPGATLGAMLLGGLLSNAGNFGVPVAQFFYATQGAVFAGMAAADDGVAVQAIVLMIASLSIWALGYGVLALAHGGGPRSLFGFFRLPIIWVTVAAFALRDNGVAVPHPLLAPVQLVAGALVPVMLLLLGAQLADQVRWPRWRRVVPVLLVKLLVLPVVTGAVAWGFGLWPWPGAQLVIAAAAPTAINTVLLSVEMQGDADTAADCVFWSTLLSSLTVTATLALLTHIA